MLQLHYTLNAVIERPDAIVTHSLGWPLFPIPILDIGGDQVRLLISDGAV